MAVKDVKKYYIKMLSQYTAEKENLNDYAEAFKAGHITEEQLADVQEYFSALENNFERIKYIMFLLDSPQRNSKKPKYNRQHKKQIAEFEANNATAEQVEAENEQLMKYIDAELDKLTKE